MNRNAPRTALLCCLTIALTLAAGCARMGQPDGGWYDETPPHVIGATPADGSVNVSATKIAILFDEFIKIENATEKVVVSPPQLESPEITSTGKRIKVTLNDSLKPNTTYTVDFSDAISDNNESNPLGNYTYSFSTGDAIDTLQVAGYVLTADALEPVKGILVGLYADHADSAFTTKQMLRVARTDSRGRFCIKGVAAGQYRVYALNDMDGNYKFSQKSEQIAFSRDIIEPSWKPDTRQDTLWADSLHIKTITATPYTHFLPDDIVLRAFTEPLTDRYFIKQERKEAEFFQLFFSYGGDQLPEVRGLNFDSEGAFLIETSAKNDTISYWLRDTTLVNQDTLAIELRYLATDTLGQLQPQCDTLEILSKKTYAKRMKDRQSEYEAWLKKEERKRKRGEAYDSIMPRKATKMKTSITSTLSPDRNVPFEFERPIMNVDTSKINLYMKVDTLWYRAPFEVIDATTYRQEYVPSANGDNPSDRRNFLVMGEWRPGVEYSLELDSAAFTDLYGYDSPKKKYGFKATSADDCSTLFVNIGGMEGKHLVVQLMSRNDNVVKEVATDNQTAEFFYVMPGTYYLRLFVDSNGNGRWDTGDYATGLQAEEVYYYPEAIECRAKWDVTRQWSPTSIPAYRQKPSAITKQKAEKEKTIRQRNAERARKLGITYTPGQQ